MNGYMNSFGIIPADDVAQSEIEHLGHVKED